VTTAAGDGCGTATCSIASVTSNESPNGNGDGNTATDWQITGPNTTDLRAERSGNGSGRIYTVTVCCTDPAGNASTGTTTVTVGR
jgi:endo-1,4-beta-xylanase